MGDLALHQMTVIEASPLELVQIAAEVGCAEIGVFVRSPEIRADDGGMRPMFPTVTPANQEAMKASLSARNIAIMNVEYFPIEQGMLLEEYRAPLMLAADLGAERAVAHVHEVDQERALAGLRGLCKMAAEYGLFVGLEFMGLSPGCNSLGKARQLVEAANCPNLGIAIDALHLVRTGGSLDEVARLDPELIAYIQLCDGKDLRLSEDYLAEAFNRLSPGEGSYPLADLLRILPTNVPIDVEVPSEDLRRAGYGPIERARRAVSASRQLLSEVRGEGT